MVKVELLGRVTADATVGEVGKYRTAKVRLACVTDRKTENGERITDFYNVTFWNSLADRGARLLKGQRVCVAGNLFQRPYNRADGSTAISMDVNASDLEFIDYQRKEEAQ